jgi:cyclopropane-fatty-acyl-phospholipid synthase
MLRAPGQLGLGRAYVSGEIEVDDIDAVLELLDGYAMPPLDGRDKARLATAAVRAGALRSVPRVPAAELRPRGRRHSRERDRRAVAHHYNISNEFFALVLGESMTYSCAIFSRGAQTLDEAQRSKLELVCTKLGLRAGERVLDVGCGWGSFALHAAREHRVHVTGITLSKPQAVLARERAAAAGLTDQIEIRVADYRDLAGEQYDAIASIGMVEHVGSANIDAYGLQLERVLRPGGRLLNHGIARLRHGDPEAGPFSERFVFPDAAPLHVSHTSRASGSTTRARCASGPATSTSAPRAPSRSPARSGCESGGCTYTPRGADSKAASRRSSRSWPTARSEATKPTPSATAVNRCRRQQAAGAVQLCAGLVPR